MAYRSGALIATVYSLIPIRRIRMVAHIPGAGVLVVGRLNNDRGRKSYEVVVKDALGSATEVQFANDVDQAVELASQGSAWFDAVICSRNLIPDLQGRAVNQLMGVPIIEFVLSEDSIGSGEDGLSQLRDLLAYGAPTSRRAVA